MGKFRKKLLVLSALFTAAALCAAEIMTDETEKKNFGFGRETQIRSIAELAAAMQPAVSADTPYLVLLSDLHMYSRADIGSKADQLFSKDVRGDLKKLVDVLNTLEPAPALVVVTGDLAHSGAPDQYQELRELFGQLSPSIPVMAIPGNHDDPAAMREILGDAIAGNRIRKIGSWTLVGLDTGKDGTLTAPERQLLKQAVSEAGEQPLLIFTHHTPIQQPGWEPVRKLREDLAGAVEKRAAATWMVSGHAHSNFLARMHYDDMPEIPVLTHTSSSSSFGYDAPSLRILFLGGEQLAGSAIWRYATPECGFRIDPPVSDWPLYTPVPRDPARELLNIDREKQKELAVERRGVGEHERYDYVDADGRLLLALPAAQYAANAPLTLELDLESDYVVRAGGAENQLVEIFNSGSRQPRRTLRWKIPEELQYGVLYLEIRDRTPEDGFGAFLHGIRLLGESVK